MQLYFVISTYIYSKSLFNFSVYIDVLVCIVVCLTDRQCSQENCLIHEHTFIVHQVSEYIIHKGIVHPNIKMQSLQNSYLHNQQWFIHSSDPQINDCSKNMENHSLTTQKYTFRKKSWVIFDYFPACLFRSEELFVLAAQVLFQLCIVDFRGLAWQMPVHIYKQRICGKGQKKCTFFRLKKRQKFLQNCFGL